MTIPRIFSSRRRRSPRKIPAAVFLAAVLVPLCAKPFIKEVVGIIPRPDAKFNADVEMMFLSGYLATSGAILDTRPNMTQCISWRLVFSENFFLDGYGWFISSLHNMQREDHRILFNEFEGALRAGHDFYFDNGMMLETKAGVLWNPPIGYHDSPMDYWGPYFAQYLRNDYVVPYWDGLWLVSPKRRARIRFGVRKPFKLDEKLSVTPFVETVWLDKRRFVSRYHEEPLKDTVLGGAFGSVTFGVSVNYNVNDNLAFFGSFSQFDIINSQARRSVRQSKSYYAKCDWPILKVGVRYSF